MADNDNSSLPGGSVEGSNKGLPVATNDLCLRRNGSKLRLGRNDNKTDFLIRVPRISDRPKRMSREKKKKKKLGNRWVKGLHKGDIKNVLIFET